MRARTGPARADDAGFTLIEMLVSLAILALISAMLVQLLFGARRALNFVNRRNSEMTVVTAQRYLRDALGQVQPSNAGFADAGISGDETRITFTTAYVPQGLYQGLYRVTVGPSRNANGRLDLVADLELVRPPKEGAAPPPHLRSELLENIAGLEISYFAKQNGDSESQWEESPSGKMPNLVLLDVQFPKRDVRVWQPLTVSVAAAATYGVRCPTRVNCN